MKARLFPASLFLLLLLLRTVLLLFNMYCFLKCRRRRVLFFQTGSDVTLCVCVSVLVLVCCRVALPRPGVAAAACKTIRQLRTTADKSCPPFPSSTRAKTSNEATRTTLSPFCPLSPGFSLSLLFFDSTTSLTVQ